MKAVGGTETIIFNQSIAWKSEQRDMITDQKAKHRPLWAQFLPLTRFREVGGEVRVPLTKSDR